MTLLATFKHISSKNADYGAAEAYLTFEHDEFTMKPTLDENGRLIPREDYRISSLNCGGEDFAVACMRANLRYEKNQKREDNHSQKLLSFRYNIDTNRVEARFTDGSAVANRMPNCLRTSSTRYFTVGLTRRIECHRFFMATAENHCNVFCVTNWSSE